IIATIIPCIFALLQFTHEIHNFIIVAIGISSVQMFVGNFLEPRLMGDSLNLSPLIIMISLVLWGTLWGIAGMFLCVPITVIAIIVFASFETTRPAAIFLSKDGKFPSIDHTHPKNSSS
ncbi:MAG: AI-2E family transporter, partial [Verrucomicrobiota bacterium]